MNNFLDWIKDNKINLTILIISIFLTLFAIETANYLVIISGDKSSVWPPSLQKTFLPDPNIFHGLEGPSQFTINDLGYRGPLIKNKDKEYRILTMGGSTTECLYLDDAETWPHLLMEDLKETNDYKKVVVMNTGKSGHNTRDNIIQLQELADDYKPDSIILMIGANDMLLKLSKRWVWEPFNENTYDRSRAFQHSPSYTPKSSIVYKGLTIIPSGIGSPKKAQDAVGQTIAKSREDRQKSNNILFSPPELEAALKDYENNINRLIEISKENNIQIIFATQPYLYKHKMTEIEDSTLWMTTDFNGNFYTTEAMIQAMERFNSKLLETCSNNKDVLCFDLEKNVPKTLDYFYDDMHFNENGAEFVAKEFAQFIKTNLKEFSN